MAYPVEGGLAAATSAATVVAWAELAGVVVVMAAMVVGLARQVVQEEVIPVAGPEELETS